MTDNYKNQIILFHGSETFDLEDIYTAFKALVEYVINYHCTKVKNKDHAAYANVNYAKLSFKTVKVIQDCETKSLSFNVKIAGSTDIRFHSWMATQLVDMLAELDSPYKEFYIGVNECPK